MGQYDDEVCAELAAELEALREKNARLSDLIRRLANTIEFLNSTHKSAEAKDIVAEARKSMDGGDEWLHVKTGGLYELVGECRIEATNTPAVLYQSKKDGTIWVRSRDEFYDGRFVNTSSAAMGESDE